MLKNIKHTKSLLFTVLIASLVFSLIPLFGFADQGTSTNETETTTKTETLPQDTIIATFGDFSITLGEFNKMWETIPQNYKAQLSKSDVLDQMISEKLLIQKAKIDELGKEEKIVEQIKKMTDQILVQALIQKEILDKTEVGDEEVAIYYEENKNEFTVKEQVHLFNILVNTEEEARDILEQLKADNDFGEIAKASSIGPSADKGGDMGFIAKGTIIPEIDKAILDLEIGELSDIIKSNYGFHILKFTEKKPESTKTLEEAKDEIIKKLLPLKQKENFDNLLEEVKSEITIEINEEALR